MIRKILSVFLLVTASAPAQTEIPLWDGPTPLGKGHEPRDVPTLTIFPPENPPKPSPAVIICPGGGYGHLAPHEGEGYAKWFVKHGVAALVLKYRLGSHGYRHPAMLLDASRAMRLARARAAEWSIDAGRIGIVGSSAGGHLASTLMTHCDAGEAASADPIERQSSRPDFGILCYAVISMGANTHPGSMDNLLDKPTPELIELLSNEKQVTKDTPTCFIWHTWRDAAVKVENSLEFAAALRRHGVPFELHVYETGIHGLGLGEGGPNGFHRWTDDCLAWMRERDFAPKP